MTAPADRYGARSGDGALAAQVAIDLEKVVDPAGYLPDPGLVDAVDVALMLRQPLLVTGEPGTGKTQLAASIAWRLGLPRLLFETKSTSVARDLFYTFDSIRRFQASHASGAELDPRAFIQFNALGMAILRTLDPAVRARYLANDAQLDAPPQRALVLIDEIDKAPRDFPNDILNEIENLYFRVPELGNEMIQADAALRPVVVITSNSEKSLPDAFLRRCIFYHIPFPDEARLEQIVMARIPSVTAGAGSLLAEVLSFFDRLRGEQFGLRKRPGTAELIGWVNALLGIGADPAVPLRAQAELGAHTLSAIAKHPEDQEKTAILFRTWVHENG
jgi:MoxR-like ATPase